MEFIDQLENALDNTIYTENGAAGYKTSGSNLMDFFFKVSSFRNVPDKELLDEWRTVENDPNALRLLYYIRDCRNGLGERRLFRVCLKEFLSSLTNYDDEAYYVFVNSMFPLILKYGRADDLFHVVDFNNRYEVELLAKFLQKQIALDWENYAQNKPLSIMYKWFPSENASSLGTKELAKEVRRMLKMSPRSYRKMLSAFRERLNVTETYMCANKWDEIDYNKVPSKANLLYKDAFLEHDKERRSKYLADLAAGKSSVKMNGEVNYPHEIYHKYVYKDNCSYDYPSQIDETCEQLWKNLKEVHGLENTLVVCDGSASMECAVSGNTTALEISRALAIYCSEHCKSAYKDKFITFSSKPQMVNLSPCKSLYAKIGEISNYDDYSNTNLEKVFDLILKVAIKNKLKQEDLPKQILIISDMEFDQGVDYTNNPIESAQNKFQQHGYDVPRLVFWNVASCTKTIPVQENKLGILLVSGFSQNVLNMVNNGETDPEKALISELNKYVDVPVLKYVK